MSADDAYKDQLAASALSRLADPPVPEGLAARIAARATATPQFGAASPGTAPVDTPAPVVAPLPQAPCVALPQPARQNRRHRLVAVSAALALLLSVGIYAGFRDRAGTLAPLAGKEPGQLVPRADTTEPPRMADAVDSARTPAAAARRQDEMRPAVPAMIFPVPIAPPVELAAEETPPADAPSDEAPAGKERLAQTGPENTPNNGLRPVYGPPAPTGLGIAGGTGGASLPGEPSNGATRGSGDRSVPPGGPTSGMPGPGGTPRGSGPRM